LLAGRSHGRPSHHGLWIPKTAFLASGG